MKRLIALTTSTAAIAVAAVVALSAGTKPAQAERWHYLIEQRLAEHARLIDEGHADGSLSRSEVFFLRAQQSQIRSAALRASADGRLSIPERVDLREMQDDAAQNIFRMRNNDEAARPVRPRPFAGLFY
jgi:hypothetical protein